MAIDQISADTADLATVDRVAADLFPWVAPHEVWLASTPILPNALPANFAAGDEVVDRRTDTLAPTG